MENLWNIYRKSIEHLSFWGRSGVDLEWIWGRSGKYLGGILALVRTSCVDLEVSGVDLGSIWPSCALPPSAKIYRKSIEHLSKIYRTSIEHLLNIYRTSIEHVANIHRKTIEHVSNIYRTSIENQSNIYGKSIENQWKRGSGENI